MKKLIIATFCIVTVFLLCGCGSAEQPLQEYFQNTAFEKVSSDDSGTILRHKETGVCYYYRSAGYGGGLTVMVNPDGTPYVIADSNE